MAFTPRGRGGDRGGSRGGDRGGFRGGRGGAPRGGSRGQSSRMILAAGSAGLREVHVAVLALKLDGCANCGELLLKHSVQADLATEEAGVEAEEHREAVAPPEEADAEVQEEEANLVRKEAQRPLSYVCRLSP